MTAIKFVHSARTDRQTKVCTVHAAIRRMFVVGNGGKWWKVVVAAGEVERLWLWSLVYGAHLIINPVQHTNTHTHTLAAKRTWLCLCTAQQNGDNSCPPSHTIYYDYYTTAAYPLSKVF